MRQQLLHTAKIRVNPQELTNRVKRKAADLGFVQQGVCAGAEPPWIERFSEWLEAGYAGEMRYLPDRRDAYEHPKHVLEGVRSLVLLLFPYRTEEPRRPGQGEGRISRYAWGTDYHDVIREKLHGLADDLRLAVPEACTRGVVDTAPLFEREFAQLAGLGWIGKNTLLLNREWGSWFFLAALLTDVELVYDAPFEADHCGTCRACLEACPTDAFADAYVLDARKCISYLTIELRESIPAELRPGVGDWLFGCDVCQDVCPWNHRVPQAAEPRLAPEPEHNPVVLAELFALSDEEFRARFRHTPLWRAKRRGILRNAAIVLGNQRSAAALPALARGLVDCEPLVRGACAWALGQIGTPEAIKRLQSRESEEPDAAVREELRQAVNMSWGDSSA